MKKFEIELDENSYARYIKYNYRIGNQVKRLLENQIVNKIIYKNKRNKKSSKSHYWD